MHTCVKTLRGSASAHGTNTQLFVVSFSQLKVLFVITFCKM